MIGHGILKRFISIVLVCTNFDAQEFQRLPFNFFPLTLVSEGNADFMNSLCANAIFLNNPISLSKQVNTKVFSHNFFSHPLGSVILKQVYMGKKVS